MKVVILCGGKGLRMGALFKKTPKPLIPIDGMPLVFRIIKQYMKFGLNEFILCTGSNTKIFQKKVKNLPNKELKFLNDAKIKIVNTGTDTPTGGRIKLIEEYIDSSFCVTYGDGLCNFSLDEELILHKQSNLIATMLIVRARTNFGIVNIQNGIIESFLEKPKISEWINGGFFILEPEIFKYLTTNSIFEVDVLPKLTKNKQLGAFKHKRFWQCMDNQKDYEYINRVFTRLGRMNNAKKEMGK